MLEVNTSAVDDVLARLSAEFVASARDQIDDIEVKLDWLESGREFVEDDLFSIQRNIHNIKGQGATFGFPLTGRVAHMLEDYLSNFDQIKTETIKDIRTYLDLMADLIASGESIAKGRSEALLKDLPSGQPNEISSQEMRNVRVLLVMPAGLQRKLVARELVSCGFHVLRAYDSIEALSVAMDIKPEFVFVNYDMTPFTGPELANVFSNIDKLKDTRFALFTSYEKGNAHLEGLPNNISVVEKRQDFAVTLSELMISWGLFGDFGT